MSSSESSSPRNRAAETHKIGQISSSNTEEFTWLWSTHIHPEKMYTYMCITIIYNQVYISKLQSFWWLHWWVFRIKSHPKLRLRPPFLAIEAWLKWWRFHGSTPQNESKKERGNPTKIVVKRGKLNLFYLYLWVLLNLKHWTRSI